MRDDLTRPVARGPAAGKAGAGRTWLAACAGLALLAIFVFIAYEVPAGGFVVRWDGRVTDSLVGIRSTAWSRVFWGATLLGNAWFMATYLVAAVVLFLAWGRWRAAILLAVGTGLAEVVSAVAKAVINRPRPAASLALIQQPGSHSLPSGHAFMTLVVAGLLLHLLFRPLGEGGSLSDGLTRRRVTKSAGVVVAVLLLVLVGASRVYLGVHWASDVIGGWCLGGFWLILVLGSVRRWRRDERLAGGPRPWLGRGWRVGLVALLVVVAAVALVLTAQADPLL